MVLQQTCRRLVGAGARFRVGSFVNSRISNSTPHPAASQISSAIAANLLDRTFIIRALLPCIRTNRLRFHTCVPCNPTIDATLCKLYFTSVPLPSNSRKTPAFFPCDHLSIERSRPMLTRLFDSSHTTLNSSGRPTACRQPDGTDTSSLNVHP